MLRKRSVADAFCSASERDSWSNNIYRAIDQVYLGLLDFFRTKRGKGAKATDISNFFYRPHQHTRFESYWRGGANKRRGRFNATIQRFANELTEKAEE